MEKASNCRESEPLEEDKPLKKARYMWEVKGKSYLKNSPDSAPLKAAASIAPDPSTTTSRDVHAQESPASASCCTEALLSEAQAIISEYSSEEDEAEKPPTEAEAPSALRHKKQDYFLQKWQARQIARGFVDNTINSMLETWENRPFDASSFVDDCETEGPVSLVEDDAILMAIQSHGLQSGWSGSTSNSFNVSTLNSNSNSSFNSNISMAGSSRSESFTDNAVSNSNLQESSVENLENLQKEQEIRSSIGSSPSSMSVNLSNVYEEDMKDPMDFLNAAVSAAIQKKGLTYA